MPKVYDCFIYFNEADILEIRLNELDTVVDYFVLVEATRTHQKKPKPLHFDINDPRFSKFQERIIHIIVDDYPNFFTHWRIPKVWDYEKHQRNAIGRGLVNAKPDDIIIVSDIDEIPNAKKVAENLTQNEPIVFQQRFFYYFLNYAVIKAPTESCQICKNGLVFWRGTIMLKKSAYIDAQSTRELRNDLKTKQIEEGGWHFSYIGGIDSILYKLKSFTHAKEAKQLHDLDDKAKIAEIVASGQDIFNRDMSFKALPLSEPFPQFILNNTAKYEKLLCEYQ